MIQSIIDSEGSVFVFVHLRQDWESLFAMCPPSLLTMMQTVYIGRTMDTP